jgi:lipoprotein-releasing system permease protein
MKFEFFVAWRYLSAKRRQAAVSVITAISVVGVMAGVAALVVALAINNGFRSEMEQRLLGASADITLLRAANEASRITMRWRSGSPSCPASSPLHPAYTNRF